MTAKLPVATIKWTPIAIRKRMIDFDLKIKEFAYLVGVSPRVMSELLNGHRPMRRIIDLRIDEVFRQLEAEKREKGA